MRILLIFLIFIVTQGCSFDKKSGIWKSEINNTDKKEKDGFQNFKNITTANTFFKKEIKIKNNFNFNLPIYMTILSGKIFFNQFNNLKF